MEYFRPYINKEDGRRNSIEDVHHILCRSRGGSNEFDNKIRLYQDLHKALHRVFGNGTPKEQLEQLLKINAQALSLEFQTDIAKLLKENDDEYYYKNGVILRK